MSRIIKSQWANASASDQKVISIRKLQTLLVEEPPSDLLHNAALHHEIISDAKLEAEMIIKEAQTKAQSILEQISSEKEGWEQEKAMMVEQARNDGLSQGISQGKEQGYNEYHDTILFAQEVVNASKRDYQQHISSAEKTILQLGIKVAEKILGERLESNEGYMSIVKNALMEAREYQEVKLHVNPGRYEFLLSRKDELIAIFPYENDIYIYPNDELSETACIIESANGRIDAAVDSQLEEMKRKLLELLESGS